MGLLECEAAGARYADAEEWSEDHARPRDPQARAPVLPLWGSWSVRPRVLATLTLRNGRRTMRGDTTTALWQEALLASLRVIGSWVTDGRVS